MGNDVRDLLAKKLVASVSELLLRLQIEKNDLAGLVHDDHRIGGSLEESPVPAFHLRKVVGGPITGATSPITGLLEAGILTGVIGFP